MSVDRIAAFLSEAEFGVYAMSLDQRIVFWNQGAERILGHPAHKVLGRHCYEVVAGLVSGRLTPACVSGCPSLLSLQAGAIPNAVRMQMLCSSGERKTVDLTPMVVSGVVDDAPLMVHVFDDRAGSQSPDQILAAVKSELGRGGAEVVSENPAPLPPVGAAPLTSRELEVLALVALGRTTSSIAEGLGISEHTVRNHVRNFRRKLNAATKLEAVLTALRRGILEWA